MNTQRVSLRRLRKWLGRDRTQTVALASRRRPGRHRPGLAARPRIGSRRFDAATARPEVPPKAKRVVQLFMSGAASQVDTFDYKPGTHQTPRAKFDPGGNVELFQSAPGACMQSPWKWQQHGQCGKWISDLLPHLATCVDDIASSIRWSRNRTCTARPRSCRTPASCCPAFPSMGAWVRYGLGSVNDNLPTFVVLPDSRGFAAERAGQLERRLSAGRHIRAP